MPHPAAQALPIMEVAVALGLTGVCDRAHCFNGGGHEAGYDGRLALRFDLQTNRYCCWGCGVRGDSIDLVQAVRRVGFGPAVR